MSVKSLDTAGSAADTCSPVGAPERAVVCGHGMYVAARKAFPQLLGVPRIAQRRRADEVDPSGPSRRLTSR